MFSQIQAKRISNEDEGIGSPYSCEEVEEIADPNLNVSYVQKILSSSYKIKTGYLYLS